MADDDPLLLRGLSRRPDDEPVGVRLCRGLPTSFVYQNGERIDGKKHNMIYLQAELPPQRRGAGAAPRGGTTSACITAG
ncbi:MAG: hypothetical protein ACLTR8_03275 [Oscillospiraceae bacterium]